MDRSPGYALLRRFARLLVSVFYRRVDVVGLEHVPATGPLILVANHHNALVDPILLLAAIPRRLVPVAKAPLFHHPLIGPFLRLAGAMPAHRRQDAAPEPPRRARHGMPSCSRGRSRPWGEAGAS